MTCAVRPVSKAPGEQARSGSAPSVQPAVFVLRRTNEVVPALELLIPVASARGAGPASCGVRVAVTAIGTATAATIRSALVLTVRFYRPRRTRSTKKEETRPGKGLRPPRRSALHLRRIGGRVTVGPHPYALPMSAQPPSARSLDQVNRSSEPPSQRSVE